MATNGNGVKWAGELARKYSSGIAHMFVLHFNVRDYAAGLAPVESYLSSMFASRDLVISYDLASGIQFANPGQREKFIEATGLQAGSGQDAIMAAMGLPGVGVAQQKDVELPRDPARALPLLEQALHLPGMRVAVIIRWAEQICPAGDNLLPADRVAMVTLARWATDPTIIANQGIVVLLTDQLSALAAPLRASTSRIEAVAIPLPDEGSRLAWIEMYLQYKREDGAAAIETKAWDAIRDVYAHEIGGDWYWKAEDSESWLNSWTGSLDSAPESKLKEVKEALKSTRSKIAASLPSVELEMPIEALARMTAGLGLVHIEDIFLRSMDERVPVSATLVKERKRDIIATEFGEVLEILEPRWGLDMIAGNKELKAFLQADVVEALKSGDTTRAPQGVLLVGPPGTGKTALVEALAYECGFNCINLNLARILGSYVGQSERNLEKALLAITALTPCLVFMDEVDQKLGRRSEGPQGDSGVGARLFSRLMEFLSDTAHRGRIVFLAASNRPDLLDAAFTRPGRFDAIAPMLPPSSDEERLELFDVMLRKYGLVCDGAHQMLSAASLASGYTGAEIEAVVRKAHKLAGRAGRPAGTVHPDDILAALHLIRPSTRDIEFMTNIALAMVSDMELVPERFRDRAADKKALETEIKAGQPVRSQREL